LGEDRSTTMRCFACFSRPPAEGAACAAPPAQGGEPRSVIDDYVDELLGAPRGHSRPVAGLEAVLGRPPPDIVYADGRMAPAPAAARLSARRPQPARASAEAAAAAPAPRGAYLAGVIGGWASI
ncbi:unnamed protein product, partial [Prorocentrum cordatum]